MRMLVYLAISLFIVSSSYAATPTIEWTSIEDLSSSSDFAQGIALDSQENSYIVGYCPSNCGPGESPGLQIRKYDEQGSLIWSQSIDHGNDDQRLLDVVVDSQDNAIATGYCNGCGSQGGWAWFTAKYDQDGQLLWSNITDPSDGTDAAQGVAVDSQDNIYVTGYCHRCTSSTSMYTIKYDSSGNHVWTDIHDPGTQSDYARDIAIDRNDNIYIAGKCTSCSGSGSEVYTLSYDAGGNINWIEISNLLNAEAMGIATTAAAEVFVGGACIFCDQGFDEIGFVIKYDANGNELWRNTTDPIGKLGQGSVNKFLSVATDHEGSVYAAGTCSGCLGSTSGTHLRVKFDGDGNHQWTNVTNILPGNGESLFDMVVGTSGTVYYTGSCNQCGPLGASAFYTLALSQELTPFVTTCSDGIKNQDEEGVDCGGVCDACQSSGGDTIIASCFDILQNGNESDVDCGGHECLSCTLGQQCVVANDCDSGVCNQGVCDINISVINQSTNVSENVSTNQTQNDARNSSENESVEQSELENNIIIDPIETPEDAQEIIEESQRLVEEINNRNIEDQEMQQLLRQAQQAVAQDDYAFLEAVHKKIVVRYNTIIPVADLLDDVKKQQRDAHNSGISTPQTDHVITVAEQLVKEGKYEQAKQQLEHAQRLIEVESSGEEPVGFTGSRSFGALVFLFVLVVILGLSVARARHNQ